ncbi:MAG: radical SAM protein [Candidatus Methanomethylophilaceae archaeon]
MEEDLRKKSELILGGAVSLPEGFVLPVRISRSTAGPGAGSEAVVFRFGRMRVKKAVTCGPADFELRDDGGRLSLWRDGSLFIDGVTMEPVGFHAPQQAFFNLDPRCMFHCVYCNSPYLGSDSFKGLTPESIVGMMDSSPQRESFTGVAFTSGVYGSIQATVDNFCRCVSAVKEAYPDLPIGVEPYVDRTEQIDALHDAGADEIKINIETARKDLFGKACPDLDYDNTFVMLAHAVDVFGRGRVCSNLIYGLGESDADVRDAMDRLASMGVMANLRPLRLSDANRDRMRSVFGDLEPITPERMERLALMQMEIFSEHGLSPDTMHTMCFACRCCDLIPFSDL